MLPQRVIKNMKDKEDENMSLKYKKWRDLSVNPFSIKFKKIVLLDVYSYPVGQNDVIECDCEYAKKKTKCFIKIERSKMACFSTEVENVNTLYEKGFYDKCPRIIESGDINNKKYIVLEKIKGFKISELLRQGKKIDMNRYLFDYGRELARIHKIPISDFNKAKQRIINDVPNEENYGEFDSVIKKYIKWLVNNKPSYKMDTFIHGDFHYSNILWNKDKISGVLDFEYSGIGFKEQDIAWSIVLRPCQLFLDTINEINRFLEGYKEDNTYNEALLKWCLVNAFCHFYLMNSDEKYRKKVITLLDTVNKSHL